MKTLCVLLLLLLSSAVAQAGLSTRSSDGSGEGCMKIAVSFRALNSSAIGVRASASKLSTFTFNGVQKCTAAYSCTYSWLLRDIKRGVTTMDTEAVSGSCAVGIQNYLDKT